MSDFSFTVEEMNVSDVPEIIEIWGKTPNMCFTQSLDYSSVVIRYLQRNPGLSFIAKESTANKIVGTLLAGTDGMYGTLRHAVVVEGYRGNGVMKSLIDMSLAGMKTYDVYDVSLYVLEDNGLGKNYFEKNGWTKVSGVSMYSLHL